jgi:hypothetical protein
LAQAGLSYVSEIEHALFYRELAEPMEQEGRILFWQESIS